MKIQVGCIVSLALLAVCGCATVNESKTPDAAIDDFMREYIGVQFGDDISKINGYEDGQYSVSMKKPFRYFDKVCCYYRKGKLYRINVWADIGKEYSQASTEVQLKKSLSDFAEEMGLARTYFMYNNWGGVSLWEKPAKKECNAVKPSYSLQNANGDLPNFRRYCIDIIDTKLDESLKSDKIKMPAYKPVTDETRRNWGVPLPDAK